jgi:hippurate hydrolase
VDPHDLAVVTVGAIHAGTKNNIIPAEATLDLSLRYRTTRCAPGCWRRWSGDQGRGDGERRDRGSDDRDAAHAARDDQRRRRDRARDAAFRAAFGEENVIDPGLFTGSEDVSWFARDAGVPLVFWFWGGIARRATPPRWRRDGRQRDRHQPLPVLRRRDPPHDRGGVRALTVAAREFLD